MPLFRFRRDERNQHIACGIMVQFDVVAASLARQMAAESRLCIKLHRYHLRHNLDTCIV